MGVAEDLPKSLKEKLPFVKFPKIIPTTKIRAYKIGLCQLDDRFKNMELNNN